MYLLHYPVGRKAGNVAQRLFLGGTVWQDGAVAVPWLTEVTASDVFYRVFEAHFERWQCRFKARPLPAI